MKHFYYISIFFFLFGFQQISAQAGISGYVSLDHSKDWEQEVHLSKIFPEKTNGAYTSKIIESSPIHKDGYFSFDHNLLSEKNDIYKVQINPLSTAEQEIISDKVKNYKLFILSKKDTIQFAKGKTLFSGYKNSNKADQEWQKLKKFETRYENLTLDFDPKQYLLETKGYVKDSLQILLVKLIGIKKLDDQNLLEKDIKANPKYYMDFLEELKSSEIDPNFYIYLENKLIYTTKQITAQKYTLSLWGNIVAILIICLLVIIMIKYQKLAKKKPAPTLSKQEERIKALMLLGKSNKEIANELFISLSTVKTHITNIYGKLNISSRRELLLKK